MGLVLYGDGLCGVALELLVRLLMRFLVSIKMGDVCLVLRSFLS